jgi:hypothetical protein
MLVTSAKEGNGVKESDIRGELLCCFGFGF